MVDYIIASHDVLQGWVRTEGLQSWQASVRRAEYLFASGAYLWVDVLHKDKKGQTRQLHHLARRPNKAEREAIKIRTNLHK